MQIDTKKAATLKRQQLLALRGQVRWTGDLNALRATQWSRQAFAQELTRSSEKLPIGVSVMEQLHQEARY